METQTHKMELVVSTMRRLIEQGGFSFRSLARQTDNLVTPERLHASNLSTCLRFSPQKSPRLSHVMVIAAALKIHPALMFLQPSTLLRARLLSVILERIQEQDSAGQDDELLQYLDGRDTRHS